MRAPLSLYALLLECRVGREFDADAERGSGQENPKEEAEDTDFDRRTVDRFVTDASKNQTFPTVEQFAVSPELPVLSGGGFRRLRSRGKGFRAEAQKETLNDASEI